MSYILRELGVFVWEARLRYFDLWYCLMTAELRSELARHYLGLIWWIVEPLMYLGAFYIVFAGIWRQSDAQHVPMLLVGLITWKWFDSTVRGASFSISSNWGLMQQAYIPKYIFPAVKVGSNTARFLTVFLLLIAYLVLSGHSFRISFLYVPLLVIIELSLILALSLLTSSIVAFLPDFRIVVDNLMNLLLFVSGVFFDIASVPDHLKHAVYFNPMFVIIQGFRDVILYGVTPDISSLTIVWGISIAVGFYAYRRIQRLDLIFPKTNG